VILVHSLQRTMAEAAEVASLDRVLTRLALTEEDSLEKARRRSALWCLQTLNQHCACATVTAQAKRRLPSVC